MSQPTESAPEKPAFNSWLQACNLRLPPVTIETMWLNITRLCNQSCRHCHVAASPDTPMHMSDAVIDACLSVIRNNTSVKSVDITGGAPELHPRFEPLVRAIRASGKKVTVRHNLTVTLDGHPLNGESKEYLPDFFAENRVEILASLPSWDKDAVDAVRGHGVFTRSIESLRRLNTAGYGRRPELVIKLVANHDGQLTEGQREMLESRFQNILNACGIVFNGLLTVTNMPVGRYAERLCRTGTYDEYMETLVGASERTKIKNAVCRTMLSVGLDGRMYDCDFNQALGLRLDTGSPQTIFDFDYDRLRQRTINFGDHCFGCSAGAGSG